MKEKKDADLMSAVCSKRIGNKKRARRALFIIIEKSSLNEKKCENDIQITIFRWVKKGMEGGMFWRGYNFGNEIVQNDEKT